MPPIHTRRRSSRACEPVALNAWRARSAPAPTDPAIPAIPALINFVIFVAFVVATTRRVKYPQMPVESPLQFVGPKEPKPAWLKVRAPGSQNYVRLKGIMQDLKLNTVCEDAHCPNIGECWHHGTATFMILGDVCTRACAYCAVAHGKPNELDTAEPGRVAEAVARMGLQYAVITSVDRDDLADGGAFDLRGHDPPDA